MPRLSTIIARAGDQIATCIQDLIPERDKSVPYCFCQKNKVTLPLHHRVARDFPILLERVPVDPKMDKRPPTIYVPQMTARYCFSSSACRNALARTLKNKSTEPPSKANSTVWKGAKPYSGKTKTNGERGKNKEYHEWDHTHKDIEVMTIVGTIKDQWTRPLEI
jgi:hypothetical protein